MYLDRILARHREIAAADTRVTEQLIDGVGRLDPTRGFSAALRRASSSSLGVIAEVKRRSPSKGDLFPDLDPAQLARTYESAGAACMSVLTDEEFFGGSVDDLQSARSAVSIPVIRKDFTVSANDVVDTRLIGADCVLLIAAALELAELRDFHALAHEIGLDALVEVHDERELEQALEAGGTLIGVNQRDLVTFEVDHQRALRMAREIDIVVGDAAVKVAESGVRDADDAQSLRRAGYDAVLVGETLVTSDEPAATVRELCVP